MEGLIYTVTLSDGTKLENLGMNGNNFVSATEVTEEMFVGKLAEVTIENGETTETMHDAELVQIAHYGNLGWYFILREIPADERASHQLRADVDYLLIMEG